MMKLANAEQVPGTDVHLVLQIVHQAEINRDENNEGKWGGGGGGYI